MTYLVSEPNKRFTIWRGDYYPSCGEPLYMQDGEKHFMSEVSEIAEVCNLLNEMHETIKRYEDADIKEEA